MTAVFHCERLAAQSVVTAAIGGTVRSEAGDVDGAEVLVVNAATGYRTTGQVRQGRFTIRGLEFGGPYSVSVRRLGFVEERRVGIFLGLGDPLDLPFVLTPAATTLAPVHIVAQDRSLMARSSAGGATVISDSLLHRLPTLNRDLYDVARISPNVSTHVLLPAGGMSAAGASLRFNNFQLDGASDRFLTGNSAFAQAGGKSVSIEAVKEFQVLLAPFDVQYGDFAGALVNAVTRGGTNELHGSAFAYTRSGRLSRDDTSYSRTQYGFAVGGPIVHDRLHFFFAPEFQSLTAPAAGPYIGQPSGASPPVAVRAADVERFTDILRSYGLAAGSSGAVMTTNPLANLFARIDYAVPSSNTRVVLSENYLSNSSDLFSRASQADTFTLSSFRARQKFATRLTSLRVHSSLRRGGENELLVSHRMIWGGWTPEAREPLILVTVPSSIDAAATILRAGTAPNAQDVSQRAWTFSIGDNITLPIGAAHEWTAGGQAERFLLRQAGVNGGYGTWTFSSLDSLARGQAQRFDVNEDRGSASKPIGGGQYSLYTGDRWRMSGALTLIFGVRADALVISDRAPYNPSVDSLFHRRTDEMPVAHVHLSPRFGFDWTPFGSDRDRIRGGVGIFTGRPPLLWLQAGVVSYGGGTAALRCQATAPQFVPDYHAAPTACDRGPPASPGAVDLLDRHLRMAQTTRASLAYDRKLPGDFTLTVEQLITRNTSDFVLVNMNLKGPQAVDSRGRVMYGVVNGSGVAAPSLVAGDSSFTEVMDLRNNASNRSSSFSVRLEKRFVNRFEGTASYTYSRVRDVELPIRAGVSQLGNWGTARVVSQAHDELGVGVSSYDLPHRVIVAGTYSAPWRRWATDFSVYYIGESGTPFTYVAWGRGRRGDLNADGALGNDPIYVPRSAFDTTQIVFSGRSDVTGADNSDAAQAIRRTTQQAALDRLIESTPCLRRQRGQIMARNSCREPWKHTSIAAVRQSLPWARGRSLSAELEVFNALNLLNAGWGISQTANTALIEQVGQTSSAAGAAQPVFRFDSDLRHLWVKSPAESTFQLQLSLRYGF